MDSCKQSRRTLLMVLAVLWFYAPAASAVGGSVDDDPVNAITKNTALCQTEIAKKSRIYYQKVYGTIQKCIDAIVKCDSQKTDAKADDCRAKLTETDKGACSEGKLDAGTTLHGPGNSDGTDKKDKPTLPKELAKYRDALDKKCFDPEKPVDLFTVMTGLGFENPGGTTDGDRLMDQLNEAPGGITCTAYGALRNNYPLVDDILAQLAPDDASHNAAATVANGLPECGATDDCSQLRVFTIDSSDDGGDIPGAQCQAYSECSGGPLDGVACVIEVPIDPNTCLGFPCVAIQKGGSCEQIWGPLFSTAGPTAEGGIDGALGLVRSSYSPGSLLSTPDQMLTGVPGGGHWDYALTLDPETTTPVVSRGFLAASLPTNLVCRYPHADRSAGRLNCSTPGTKLRVDAVMDHNTGPLAGASPACPPGQQPDNQSHAGGALDPTIHLNCSDSAPGHTLTDISDPNTESGHAILELIVATSPECPPGGSGLAMCPAMPGCVNCVDPDGTSPGCLAIPGTAYVRNSPLVMTTGEAVGTVVDGNNIIGTPIVRGTTPPLAPSAAGPPLTAGVPDGEAFECGNFSQTDGPGRFVYTIPSPHAPVIGDTILTGAMED